MVGLGVSSEPTGPADVGWSDVGDLDAVEIPDPEDAPVGGDGVSSDGAVW